MRRLDRAATKLIKKEADVARRIQIMFKKGDAIRASKLEKVLRAERSGVVLILMTLLIVVICTLIWLDPMALIHGSGLGMPWNEEFRLVRPDEEIRQPAEGQPKILNNLRFPAEIVQDGEVRGGINLYILTDGQVKGDWGGVYKPSPEITWEVMGSRFKGNIDPSKIYSDEEGKDPERLYFIAKGKFLILETNSDTDKVRTANGAIYVTGWLNNEYKAAGKVTITSDKKTYWEYDWQGKGEKALIIPDFGRPLPGLF